MSNAASNITTTYVGSPKKSAQRIWLPVSPNRSVCLEVPAPLTAQEWDFMLGILTSMRPALVEDAPGGDLAEQIMGKEAADLWGHGEGLANNPNDERHG